MNTHATILRAEAVAALKRADRDRAMADEFPRLADKLYELADAAEATAVAATRLADLIEQGGELRWTDDGRPLSDDEFAEVVRLFGRIGR